jgi:hypothetical protein
MNPKPAGSLLDRVAELEAELAKERATCLFYYGSNLGLANERDEARAEVERLKALADELADEKTYESEYDGINSTRCAYCDTNLDYSDKHADDCLMLRARSLIAWPRPQPARTSSMRAEFPDYKERCPVCNRRFAGVADHMKAKHPEVPLPSPASSTQDGHDNKEGV